MMKYVILCIIIVLVVGGLFYTNEKQFPQNGSALAVEEFHLLSKDDAFVLIDIRNERELEETGVIAGLDDHKNVYNLDHVADLEALDRQGKYLFYCAHGNRSAYLKEHLISLGFAHVYDLSGGEAKWTEQEYPLEQRK